MNYLLDKGDLEIYARLGLDKLNLLKLEHYGVIVLIHRVNALPHDHARYHEDNECDYTND